MSLEPWVAPDGSGTGYHLYGPSGVGSEQFDFYFRCGSGNPEPCTVASNFSFPYAGSLSVERDYPEPGAAYITLDITWTGHSSGRLIAVGTKQQAAPPTPSVIKVFITQPHNGDTASGTSWVVIWAEGASGSSNVYTLTVDNTVVFTQNAGGSLGPVSMPWNTKAFLNGTHTVTATVKDATGATGSGSISVLVNNP